MGLRKGWFWCLAKWAAPIFLDSSAIAQNQTVREGYQDFLHKQRDTLQVYQWFEGEYGLKGYRILYRRDSVSSRLPYEFMAIQGMGFPAEDNTGRAPVPMWFAPDSGTAFTWGTRWPFYLRRTPEQMGYYLTRRPYTQLMVALGTAGPPKNNRRGDQRLYLLHTQPAGRRAQWFLDFLRLASAGFYNRQWSSVSRLTGGGYVRSLKGRFLARGAVLWHRWRQEENGGLTEAVSLKEQGFNQIDPSGQEQFVPIRRKDTWPVNLSAAEVVANCWEAFLQQELSLGPWRSDSARMRVLTPWTLTARLFFVADRRQFTNGAGQSDNFFNHYYYTTGPSAWFGQAAQGGAEAGFRWAPFRGKLRFSQIGAFVQYAALQLGQDTIRRVRERKIYHNLSLAGRVHLNWDDKLEFNGRIDLQFTGYNAGAFRWEAILRKMSTPFSGRPWRPEGALVFAMHRVAPPFLQRRMDSNHFMWDVQLSPQTSSYIGTDIYIPKKFLRFRGGTYFVSRYLYYDEEALPKNFEKFFLVFQGKLEGDGLFFSRHFSLPVQLAYQESTSEVVRVPRVYGMTGFLYKGRMFGQKLAVEAGVDVYWYTRYQPLRWMPGLQIWHLQEGKFSGPYLVTNAHLSLGVKRFRCALLGFHLNRGVPKVDYWLAPGYPVFDRSVLLSIQWGLYN
ncbi:MAG: hypothetical protein N2110_05290 [Flavobacteriales bacterium]|nr:hypothetical protein [Flavobacteriales bacterium]